MILTVSQIAEIANELVQTDDNIAAAEDSIVQTEKDKAKLKQKNDTIKVFYDTVNNSVEAYYTERRWIDGTSYTTIPYSDIENGAKRALNNIFFPAGWTNFAPFQADKITGLPQSSSSDYETEILTKSLEAEGVNALIDFLVNGQSSGVGADVLEVSSPYSPGDPSIEVDSGGQTNGNLLILFGGGNSALVRVTNVAGTVLDITEIVAPSGSIPAGSSVIENIPGFTNGERNTLTSTNYQHVLDTLTDSLKDAINLWETSLDNQVVQHDANTDPDRESQIAAAKSDAENALTVISNWEALPDTGSSGSDSKFTDNNLLSITNETSARATFTSTRITQITSALGTVSQDSTGKISGQGVHRDRFERISLMINGTDGPLFQYYASDISKNASEQQIESTKQKERAFSSGIYTTTLAENPTGTNTIKVVDASNFAISDKVVITAVGFDNLVVDITGKSGNTLTLSKTVSLDYSTENKSAVSKAR